MTALVVPAYEFSMEYRNNERDLRTVDHIYLASSPADAIRGAAAFWKRRQEVIPETFSQLLCCKLHSYAVGAILGGRLYNSRGMMFFEYKIDTAFGYSFEVVAEQEAQRFEKSAKILAERRVNLKP